jgi:hypothetical protein
MARPSAPNRPRPVGSSAGGLLGLALAALTGAAPSLAGFDPQVFPPPDTFRSIQLATLACGRENTAASCERARQLADPLLDHPRLPARCKDVLWDIRQQARPEATNSPERRDRIDRAGRDVTVFCRQQVKESEKPRGPEAPQSGGGLNFNLLPGPK